MGIAAPEIPDMVPEVVVPLTPAGAESAKLVAVRTEIPWLRDHLDPAQDRIIANGHLEGMLPLHVVALVAEQRGDQVESKTVDTHLGHPVTQRVEHHPQYSGFGGVD